MKLSSFRRFNVAASSERKPTLPGCEIEVTNWYLKLFSPFNVNKNRNVSSNGHQNETFR